MATAFKPPAPLPTTDAFSAAVYFEHLAELIPRLPYDAIDAIAGALCQAIQQGQTIFVFGNGGSAASASHMMCDFNKGAILPGRSRRPKVISLTDNVPLLTAWANDFGYEQVFSEQLKSFVSGGDAALAISASGNSPNVLRALETARGAGAFTAGITGFRGGKMKALCDLCAVVPCENMQLIEDCHHAMLHSLFTIMRHNLQTTRKALAITAGRSRL